ncbi:MAG: PIN domain-containing protein [Verrucomicrobia bacterium]|nr:PIN domain-containing protein [Verrucomicrobiota bacterium]MDE3100058.1 type II toxin-antitoxin system VapC family toxin [Verrucomicrobiota bacterium]
MNAVFADTFFYLALLDEGEPAHERALAESKISRLIVTTEFILLELGNACAHAEDHADFLALVAGMCASPRVKIVSLNSELFNRGLERMRERSDKNWSLTDCISFVVMENEGIHEVLTGDQHFEQAGFKALLK